MYLKLYLKGNLWPWMHMRKKRKYVQLWSSQENKKNSKLKPRKIREKEIIETTRIRAEKW